MDAPRFSVVIPVYNVEEYLEPCLDSLLTQTYQNFEVILVNDGSSDSSPMICDKYAAVDPRVKVIHKNNGGVSAARKDAVMTAVGQYIICIDGDDWIDQNTLQKIAEVIEQTGADIVCHGMVYDNGRELTRSPLKERTGLYCREDIQKEIFPHLIQSPAAGYFIPSLCGKAIKRDILLNNILSNAQAKIGEDGACVIPCVYQAQTMYIMEECLYYYRYNVSSATKSKKVFDWEWPRIIARHISDKVDLSCSDFEEQLKRKITHDVFSVVVTQFYRKESYWTIVADIKQKLVTMEYHETIRQCRFNGSLKAKLMECCMKHSLFFLIWLYAKLH